MGRSSKFVLFFDYDGTLTRIVPHPSRAFLEEGTREWLRKIKALAQVKIAIVSGRSLAELKRMVSLKGFIYAGNHGLEISGLGMHFVEPHARRTKPALQKWAAKLKAALKKVPGVFLENKGLTLSLHYRQASPKNARIAVRKAKSLLKNDIANQVLCLTSGKKVLEVRPYAPWGKGKAVNLIVSHLKRKDSRCRYLPIYAGDDKTDEEAFRTVRRLGGLGIRIGSKNGKTFANRCVVSPEALRKAIDTFIYAS